MRMIWIVMMSAVFGCIPVKLPKSTSPSSEAKYVSQREEDKLPDYVVGARNLCWIRDSNQPRFDSYKGQRIRLLGTVQKVVQAGSQVHVHLVGDYEDFNPMHVTCKFTSGDLDALSGLVPRQTIVLDGTHESSVMGNPVLGHCKLIDPTGKTIYKDIPKGHEVKVMVQPRK